MTANWDNVKIMLGDRKIECVPTEMTLGVTCVSYKKNGKAKKTILTHDEFEKYFKRQHKLKTIRLPRKLKKQVNKLIYLITHNAVKCNPYQRILLYKKLTNHI